MSEPEPQPQPPAKVRVVVCMPGRTFSNRFLISWSQVFYSLITSGRYDVMISNHYSSQVNFARALCVGADVLAGPDQVPFQGKLEYDVMLWLDSDMVFTFEQVDALLQACVESHPVCSGIYRMEGGTHLCAVREWNLDYYREHGSFQFLTMEDAQAYAKECQTPWMKCAYAGMGFMAIRRGVLEDPRVKYPWFARDIERISMSNGTFIQDLTSEDVSLCRNLTDAGVIDGVMVHLGIQVGHEKSVVL